MASSRAPNTLHPKSVTLWRGARIWGRTWARIGSGWPYRWVLLDRRLLLKRCYYDVRTLSTCSPLWWTSRTWRPAALCFIFFSTSVYQYYNLIPPHIYNFIWRRFQSSIKWHPLIIKAITKRRQLISVYCSDEHIFRWIFIFSGHIGRIDFDEQRLDVPASKVSLLHFRRDLYSRHVLWNWFKLVEVVQYHESILGRVDIHGRRFQGYLRVRQHSK